MQAVPIRNPTAVCRVQPDGWAVLFNPDTAGALALNPTGLAIWQLIDGQRDVAAIAAVLCEQFRDVPPSVQADVTALIEILVEEGLVGYPIWPQPTVSKEEPNR
ncbi:MAG: PqqD family peptide modification chaperone [Anaerolineae bacterium]|nr:PqqD family peptide modification chaperone [Anaerolineae bacterium]MDW8070902.1 PqqD family peptide modification chaperone [Anaerolineae bacterium]